MKKLTCALLIFAMVLMSSSIFADSYKILSSGGPAKVLEVIDGETIKVEMLATKEVGLVRISGLDAQGFDEAVSYLNNSLVGKTVLVVFDPGVKTPVGRFNIMSVLVDGEPLNQKMAAKGLVVAHVDQQSSVDYGKIKENETDSKTSQIGMWRPLRNLPVQKASSSTAIVYAGDGVNINTATHYQLSQILTDVPYGVISNMIYFRETHPFNTVRDLKFVEGFTKAMFDNNKTRVTVSTDINTATSRELFSLRNITGNEVSAILNYRTSKRFVLTRNLVTENIFSEARFTENEHYMDTFGLGEIDYAIPNVRVDINTASQADLEKAGLSSGYALTIVNYRQNYTFKTLDELAYVWNLRFSKRTIDGLADNLKVEPLSNGVNLNTATLAQLKSAGFSDSQAESIYNRRGNMYSMDNVPVSLGSLDKKVALFTNINKASRTELQSLSTEMTDELINQITEYRDDQPFGSRDELRSFFSEKNKLAVYEAFQNFVAFR